MPALDTIHEQVLDSLKSAQRITLDAVKTGFSFAEQVVETVSGAASSVASSASEPAAK
jgi:hypothetical protein